MSSHEQDYPGNAKEMKDLDKKIEEKIAGIMKQYGVKRESIVVNKEKKCDYLSAWRSSSCRSD